MAEFFKVKTQVLKTPEQAYSELLGNSPENQIVDIKVDLIDEIDDQPQKIHEDKISRIAESMKIVGQLDPIIVTPNRRKGKEGHYILIAGRHRRRACIKLGLDNVKAVIKQETNPDKLRLMLLATNNDRNTDYAPSELAFSYKEQLALLKKLGSKSTASQIAQENNTNRKTVHKYIQLTNLIKPLLSRVDSNSITVGAGYELSYLTPEQQTDVFNFLLNHSDCHVTKENARAIRENPNDIENIFYHHSPFISRFPEVENDTTEILKAEKKINKLDSAKSNNCPSEGHLKAQTPFEVLMTIANIIKLEAYSIYSYVISSYPTTDEVIEYISKKYVSRTITFEGTLSEESNTPVCTYLEAKYTISFKKKLTVKLLTDTNEKETYKISYTELDSALRQFLRKYALIEDIIIAIKESKQ